MLQRGLLSTPQLDYDQWRDTLRPNWGLYTVDDPKSFAGRVRSRSICGFNAADISNNIHHCERTQRDVRLDGVDHCYAVFQMAGRSTIVQNDCAVTLAVGDVALIDSARAVTYVNEGNEQWLSLQFRARPWWPISALSRRAASVAVWNGRAPAPSARARGHARRGFNVRASRLLHEARRLRSAGRAVRAAGSDAGLWRCSQAVQARL
jgi:hypothetical protein